METFICFYHQEYVMTHCVKIRALNYEDAEDRFKQYLDDEVAYIDNDNLHIQNLDEIDYI